MNYKRYELSRSLNGHDIVHIARNLSGVVVFRAHSDEELMRLIDQAEMKTSAVVSEHTVKMKTPKKKPEAKVTQTRKSFWDRFTA